MSKQCAKCSKTVYPTEELKCLDKVWHKFCFKCTTCGMTLNLKNFQGFDRLPYCRAHTPKAKHTNVADTPEISRVKEATKNQSLASYHEDFEKSVKGTAIQVADNLEIMRLKKNQENFSQAAYHEQFEKDIRGHKIEVADDPETLRLLKNQTTISNIAYHEQFEKGIKGHKIEVADDPETLRHFKNKMAFSDAAYHENFEKGIKGRCTQIADDPETLRLLKNQNTFSNVKYQEDYIKSKAGKAPIEDGDGPDQRFISQGDQYTDTQRMPPGVVPDRIQTEETFNSPYTSRNQGSSVVYSSQGKDGDASSAAKPKRHSEYTERSVVKQRQEFLRSKSVEQNQGYRNKPGSINDYDPLNDQYGSLVAQGQQPPQQQQPYSSYSGQQWQETVPVARVQQPESHASSIESNPPQNRKGSLPAGAVPVIGMAPLSPVGKTADEKAGKREEGSPDTAKDKQATKEIEKDKLPTKDESQKPKEQPPPVSQPPPAPPSSSSAVYKAMYDYDAADDDEVSFRDGDIIINTEPIDDGWMYGTVQRSGQTGMLPSNYVERIQ